jgi:long-subunit acyl-CoA synthetase (AMP-forming)
MEMKDATMLFLGNVVNRNSTKSILQHLQIIKIPCLKNIVLIRWDESILEPLQTWDKVLSAGEGLDEMTRIDSESQVDCKETVCFQFTSGTTGAPKAAMLSHL